MANLRLYLTLTVGAVLLCWNAAPATGTVLKPKRGLGSNRVSQVAPMIAGSEYLDNGQKYHLTWNVNTEEEKIYFEVTAETKGYVGFGFSPNGGMEGADILIAGVHPNKTVYFSDYHASGPIPPVNDTTQDWEVTEAEETATYTKLKFNRRLNTCDDDDFRLTDATTHVIWSMGETDDVAYHKGQRGTKSVNFFIPGGDNFDTTKYLNHSILVTMEMPSQHTTYWCTMQRLPLFTERQHVVAFEPVLENLEALTHTHHYIFHRCVAPEGQDADELFGPWMGHAGDYCYDQKNATFPFQNYCNGHMVYVWTKGGKRMVFPEDVGLPMPEELGKNEYYILEIHYDNPNKLAGLTFQTGGRMFYTPNLRKIEAGLMVIEHSTNVALTVPPNATDFVVTGHCAPECTQELLPEEGITVFNSLLHAHLAARKIRLRHFRGNQELEWVDRDDYYDFDFQQNKPLTQFRKVERGDQLTVECTYQSTQVEGLKAVIGGLSSHEEMCQGWTFYYPRQHDASQCGSSQDGKHFELLGITGIEMRNATVEGGLQTYYITAPANLAGDYLESISHKINWTPEFREKYQQEKRYGEQIAMCTANVEGVVVKYPDNLKEYQEPNECGGGGSGAGTLFSLGFFNICIIITLINKIW